MPGKSKPKAPKPPKPPPVHQPLVVTVAANGNVRVSVGGKARAKSGRHHLPADHIQMVEVPDAATMDGYNRHVQLRVKHFFEVIGKAVALHEKYSPNPPPKMFTDIAAAQEATGFRTLTDDQDAAHLMNTTLIPEAFTKLPLTPKDAKNLEDLYRATAATTNQFQTSNVSADKIIDSCQTDQKNKMFAELATGVKLDEAFVKKHLDEFLTDALTRLRAYVPSGAIPPTLKDKSYATAIVALEAVQLDQDAALAAIMDEISAYRSGNLA